MKISLVILECHSPEDPRLKSLIIDNQWAVLVAASQQGNYIVVNEITKDYTTENWLFLPVDIHPLSVGFHHAHTSFTLLLLDKPARFHVIYHCISLGLALKSSITGVFFDKLKKCTDIVWKDMVYLLDKIISSNNLKELQHFDWCVNHKKFLHSAKELDNQVIIHYIQTYNKYFA